MKKQRNRMAKPRNREDAKPKAPEQKPSPVPVEMVAPQDVPAVVRCPGCGAGRLNQWDVCSGGRGEPYKRCRACGRKYRFGKGGTMTLVG